MHTFAPATKSGQQDRVADTVKLPLQQREGQSHEVTHEHTENLRRMPLSQVAFNFGQIPVFDNGHSGIIQPKFKINAPGDKYEQEADRIAERVMRMPDTRVQRKCSKCEEEEQIQRTPLAAQIGLVNQNSSQTTSTRLGPSISHIQRKCKECEEEEKDMIQTKGIHTLTSGSASPALTHQIKNTHGSGRVIDRPIQSFMSSRFGTDFSHVRIHTDAKAVAMNKGINAKAFTVGSDIYFNQGMYNPGYHTGKQLLAHELVHTIQQKGRSQVIQRSVESVEINCAEEVISFNHDQALLVIGLMNAK
ncbi:MAG: DUF4157 domain-containing protein [Saprospiraceae bacterium]|nr:DUF4157 domain-containing protein [Saprospiraceae bacterium]